MSVYFKKGKGWRYDFTLKGTRYTEAWFKTKSKAKGAEAEKRKELKNPPPVLEVPTDMAFLDLVNLRLDHVKAYNSERHYQDLIYRAKRWVRKWGELNCDEVTQMMVINFLMERRKVSPHTGNIELRSIRALFNFGIKRKILSANPTDGIAFFPVEKKVKYYPSDYDIDRVISVADPDTQDYLWTLRETMARVSEVNRLLWEDVNLSEKFVILYTRKKRGGHRTPRKVPMTSKLFEVLQRRFNIRQPDKPWVFWHRYWSRKKGSFCEGPYGDRKLIMKSLCDKAGVRYFRFHPIRHSGASIMDGNNVPIGAIQRILGHENRTTTEIYLHSIGDMERDAMNAFERAREKSHTDSHMDDDKVKEGQPEYRLTPLEY
jgi:integrase